MALARIQSSAIVRRAVAEALGICPCGPGGSIRVVVLAAGAASPRVRSRSTWALTRWCRRSGRRRWRRSAFLPRSWSRGRSSSGIAIPGHASASACCPFISAACARSPRRCTIRRWSSPRSTATSPGPGVCVPASGRLLQGRGRAARDRGADRRRQGRRGAGDAAAAAAYRGVHSTPPRAMAPPAPHLGRISLTMQSLIRLSRTAPPLGGGGTR